MPDLIFNDPAHAETHLTFLVMRESSATPWFQVGEHDTIEAAEAQVARLNAEQAKVNAQWDEQAADLAARGRTRSEYMQQMADLETSARFAVFIRETLPLRPAHAIMPRPRVDA